MSDKNIYHFKLYNQTYKFDIPEDRTVSDADRQAFDLFYTTLREYYGHPKQHIAALELIPQIKSLPLFAAAMAAMIASLAYYGGDIYDKSQIKVAVRWLEQGEELASEEKAILQVAIDVHRAEKNHEEVRNVLGVAESLYPDDIDFQLAKLELLGQTGTARQLKKAVHEFEKRWQENSTQEIASKVIQKQFLLKTAHAFYSYKEWNQAIKHYKNIFKSNQIILGHGII